MQTKDYTAASTSHMVEPYLPSAYAPPPALPDAANENHQAANENNPPPTPAPITGIAGWLSRHRVFTKGPFTYPLYQFVRSTIATIPYGFGMAAGHHLFQFMSAKGQKMGLNEEGIKAFTEGQEVIQNGVRSVVKGLAAVDKMEHFHTPGTRGMIGRNLMRVANSPLNAAVQIALGFTMFRFTGGVVKNLRDRIMNEKNTPQDTANEVKNAPKTIWETIKTNWPAESTGTPIAALVLGFMNAAFAQSEQYKRLPGESFKEAIGRVCSPKSKLLQNGAIWTMSYSLFFLMAESLFKDKQISRGVWKGHPNSLKNGPDDIVGGPAAVTYKTPENDLMYVGSAEEGYKQKKVENDVAQDSTQKLRFPFFTGEPSLGRFIIRRVLPVSVGITAYAALKRVGYLAEIPLPWVKKPLSGQMVQIAAKDLETMGAGDHAKLFLENAWREGKATTMFGALWWATDAWGTWYDKFFHHLQQPENKVELNEHQQQNHAELLGRLNEKEKGQGRAA